MTQEIFESELQMAYTNTSDQHDVYHYYNGNNYGHFMSDGSIGTDESNLWSSSPRSETPSPNSYVQNSICGSYQTYKPMGYSPVEHHVITYRNGYSHFAMSDIPTNVPYVRVVKRRTTANKKERRRTQSINNAYADLRDCIPNVPADTKLSKIKTLRLATSYISYLTKALESDDPTIGFKAELTNLTKKTTNQPVQSVEEMEPHSSIETTEDNQRKAKGRTGWPQHVWALELKQEQTI
ncbi:heart- and neural crest derivatives-expressed protein 2-like [Harmonia axyridis]|uniref:heart- and neural crest derivatives-expressed protein 2-like n=1 Tax=Harmonia axyridis TaxID=115357 RepID=UPI001E278567|nr:heart- and neural crest derivatives-expressed protein 2-like [Harmonia axyridis]